MNNVIRVSFFRELPLQFGNAKLRVIETTKVIQDPAPVLDRNILLDMTVRVIPGF